MRSFKWASHPVITSQPQQQQQRKNMGICNRLKYIMAVWVDVIILYDQVKKWTLLETWIEYIELAKANEIDVKSIC